MKILHITSCDECPYYVDEDTDEYHGCTYTPPYCKLEKEYIRNKDLEGDKKTPDWCPLEDKK